ncbi:hypothetical protein ACXHXG_19560 [Rhizobium sp. LEGMi198b]
MKPRSVQLHPFNAIWGASSITLNLTSRSFVAFQTSLFHHFLRNSSPIDIAEVSNVPRPSIFVRDAQTDGPLHLAAGLHDPAFHAATNERNMGRRLLLRRNNVKNRANLAEGAGKSFVHVSSRGLRTAKRLKEAIKRVMEIQAQTLSNLSDARHSLR